MCSVSGIHTITCAHEHQMKQHHSSAFISSRTLSGVYTAVLISYCRTCISVSSMRCAVTQRDPPCACGSFSVSSSMLADGKSRHIRSNILLHSRLLRWSFAFASTLLLHHLKLLLTLLALGTRMLPGKLYKRRRRGHDRHASRIMLALRHLRRLLLLLLLLLLGTWRRSRYLHRTQALAWRGILLLRLRLRRVRELRRGVRMLVLVLVLVQLLLLPASIRRSCLHQHAVVVMVAWARASILIRV